MRAIVLTAFLLAAPAEAQEPSPPGDLPLPVAAVVAAGVLIPLGLYALGEFWATACEASGNEFFQDETDGLWRCSGLPRPAQ